MKEKSKKTKHEKSTHKKVDMPKLARKSPGGLNCKPRTTSGQETLSGRSNLPQGRAQQLIVNTK